MIYVNEETVLEAENMAKKAGMNPLRGRVLVFWAAMVAGGISPTGVKISYDGFNARYTIKKDGTSEDYTYLLGKANR